LIARKLTFSALHCGVGLKRRPDVNGQFAQGFSGKSLFFLLAASANYRR